MTLALPITFTLNADGTFTVVSLISPDGTYIGAGSTATEIQTGPNSMWTLVGGVVMLNGAFAGDTANVATLLLKNGVISQGNSAGSWWSWLGGAWTAIAGDPRAPAPTPVPVPPPRQSYLFLRRPLR